MEPTVQEPQILSNENVRFSIHRKPACVVEFDVEATEKLVQTAHKKAIKAVCKEVTIPGFRKGKAPDALVVTKYEPAINKEWEKSLRISPLQHATISLGSPYFTKIQKSLIR